MADPPCKRPRTSGSGDLSPVAAASVRTPPVAGDAVLAGNSDASGSEGQPAAPLSNSPPQPPPGQPATRQPPFVPVRTQTGFEHALRDGRSAQGAFPGRPLSVFPPPRVGALTPRSPLLSAAAAGQAHVCWTPRPRAQRIPAASRCTCIALASLLDRQSRAARRLARRPASPAACGTRCRASIRTART